MKSVQLQVIRQRSERSPQLKRKITTSAWSKLLSGLVIPTPDVTPPVVEPARTSSCLRLESSSVADAAPTVPMELREPHRTRRVCTHATFSRECGSSCQCPAKTVIFISGHVLMRSHRWWVHFLLHFPLALLPCCSHSHGCAPRTASWSTVWPSCRTIPHVQEQSSGPPGEPVNDTESIGTVLAKDENVCPSRVEGSIMSNSDSKVPVVQQALKASVEALMPRAVRQLEVKFGRNCSDSGPGRVANLATPVTDGRSLRAPVHNMKGSSFPTHENFELEPPKASVQHQEADKQIAYLEVEMVVRIHRQATAWTVLRGDGQSTWRSSTCRITLRPEYRQPHSRRPCPCLLFPRRRSGLEVVSLVQKLFALCVSGKLAFELR